MSPGGASHALVLRDFPAHHPKEVPAAGITHERELLVELLLCLLEIAQRVEVTVEALVLRFKFEYAAGVGRNRFQLLSVSDDPRVTHQTIDVFGRESGHP